ncbi:MAG TPA: capsule biosynthesis GfcC family protein [Rheinheimera sp.]|uniref:capsule biosynthesis GfcC family protein n=1 Tax=Rheinheimera sp. TaxID=1869214 RepID=UPI002F92C75E
MSKSKVAALALMLCSGLSLADVNVDINGQQRSYSDNPRLADVLKPYALQQQWYWPAAALYRTDTQQAEKLRRQLLALATELAQQSDDAQLRDSLALLQAQVNQWQLADRVNIRVDYDAATVVPALNPRFDTGSYRLVLQRRPNTVFVGGAVRREVSVPHLGASDVAAYTASIKMTPGADSEQLAIVQPDGRIIKAGISYFNRSNTEAMPGAQLLVLFTEPMLDQRFSTLNTLLQQLAVHRILP